jgi:hypothetical protein
MIGSLKVYNIRGRQKKKDLTYDKEVIALEENRTARGRRIVPKDGIDRGRHFGGHEFPGLGHGYRPL